MSQGNVSHGVGWRWLKLLLPLLKQALQRLQLLPSRSATELYMNLKVLADYFILLDATERPIPRPVDHQQQQHDYSGKKGCHTIKNNLIINKEQQIFYLSNTVEGKLHNKALANEMQLSFPPEGVMMQVLDFLGCASDHVKVVMPEKKPKNQQLSSQDKAFDNLVSSMGVTVKHAIAGIKILRIVQEKIRLRIENIQEEVMIIACGIHNLRISYRIYRIKSNSVK